ncbi:Hypothetical predicted protein [Octopus vulgaris]|uniref:Helix-turn-helix domain-containing protein n=1 Tax=Octopus vulgaris TaxID=6645 RepID=A0AA36F3E1_OCTVU|nr:Hypothetical predicted protein [Octopus vulgaris]
MTRSRDEVRRLNAMFQQAARKDKEKYWNEECARAEEANRKGNMRELYQHVKKTRTAFMARQATIRGRNGEELHDQKGIRKRWKEYTEQLYAGNNLDEQAEDKPLELELEPDILEDEVVWAMKQLANRKGPGTDGIPLELLKPIPTKTLTSLCQRIWRTCKTQPYHKINENLRYINVNSNHPHSIKKSLINNISKRISLLSYDLEIFNKHATYYNEALREAAIGSKYLLQQDIL